jgi:hypothetical protein
MPCSSSSSGSSGAVVGTAVYALASSSSSAGCFLCGHVCCSVESVLYSSLNLRMNAICFFVFKQTNALLRLLRVVLVCYNSL